MPGIAGIISPKPDAECRGLVVAMIEAMQHESFYDAAIHEVPAMGIYAGWAAHSGSPAANQPFQNETGEIVLLLSGECFTAPDTLDDLRRKGHTIGERDDWLVHHYEELGDRFFESLNGLFSGLLIDKRRRQAFLFNDRYGLERIYFCETRDGLYFASEAKALLRVLPETRAFNRHGLSEYLTYGCTLDWHTLFQNVSLLPGGSLWTLQNETVRKGAYFTPAQWESLPQLGAQEFEGKFRECFARVIPQYFQGDSNVGISLTGGLDTRMILASLPSGIKTPHCYTFAGPEGMTLDARLAGRVAATLGLNHELLRIKGEFFEDFAAYADKTVYCTDGGFGVLGSHEIYLNRLARSISPVRLTGNYGSEVLRSMSTLKPLKLARELLASDFRQTQEYLAGTPRNEKGNPVTFAAFEEIPWNLFGGLAAARSQVICRTPYLDNRLVALAFQAPARLRTSPFSALRFVQSCHPKLAAIPTDRGLARDGQGITNTVRHALAEVSFKFEYHTDEGLPGWLSPMDSFIQRSQSAVGLRGLHKYLHYRSWFRNQLADHLRDMISTVLAAQTPFWNPKFLESLASAHINGRANYLGEINTVLTLEAVERLLIRAAPRSQPGPTNDISLAPLQKV